MESPPPPSRLVHGAGGQAGLPCRGSKVGEEWPNGPAGAGEFRELVLIETETPPLADAALGHLHLLSPPRVQLEGSPTTPPLFPSKTGLRNPQHNTIGSAEDFSHSNSFDPRQKNPPLPMRDNDTETWHSWAKITHLQGGGADEDEARLLRDNFWLQVILPPPTQASQLSP